LTTWDQGVYKYDGKKITNYAVKDGIKKLIWFQCTKTKKASFGLVHQKTEHLSLMETHLKNNESEKYNAHMGCTCMAVLG
jgi:hypothetical protein